MASIGTFPFGQPVKKLVQQDRSPKKVFVLGVYASAVHAHWIGPDRKTVVRALAVASEPYIFWRGEGPEDIIRSIAIPKDLGTLESVESKFDGPSGKALDDLFLKPLGFTREDAWLCDLVPYSGSNDGQKKAIKRAYLPVMQRYGLPHPTVPDAPDESDVTNARRQEILDELRESQAKLLILLGDLPIKWFLRHFDDRWGRLGDFMPYGQRCRVSLDGLEVDVLPLCHPRQAGKLGRASQKWFELHQEWVEERAAFIARGT